MKIIKLTQDAKKNILENLLKRSPHQYTKYDDGTYNSPPDLLTVYRTRLSFVLKLMDLVSQLDAEFSDIITKLMFS